MVELLNILCVCPLSGSDPYAMFYFLSFIFFEECPNDVESTSPSLSQICNSMLVSTNRKINSEQFQQFFKQKDVITNNNVDCYINEFLLKALVLEENRQQALLDATDCVVFGDDSQLVQKRLERVLQLQVPLEDTVKVLVFVADKYMKLRIFPKFCTHLLKAIETSGRKSITLPAPLLECLADCAMKIPVAQNMAMWISLCLVLKKDSCRFHEDPNGSSNRAFKY